jgi:hypothetical protein
MSRDQQNQIFSAAIEEAAMLLEKQGEFFPFALGLRPDESIAVFSAYDGDDCPPSSEVVAQLIGGLKQEALEKKIIASAITYEVNGTFDSSKGSQSAVCVAIEHTNLQPITCFQPFELEGSNYIGGEVIAQEGVANVFAAHNK